MSAARKAATRPQSSLHDSADAPAAPAPAEFDAPDPAFFRHLANVWSVSACGFPWHRHPLPVGLNQRLRRMDDAAHAAQVVARVLQADFLAAGEDDYPNALGDNVRDGLLRGLLVLCDSVLTEIDDTAQALRREQSA